MKQPTLHNFSSSSLSLFLNSQIGGVVVFFRTKTPQLNQPAKTGKMPLWLLQESRQLLGSDPWEHSRLAGWRRWTLFGTPLSNGTRPGKPYPWQHGPNSKRCLLTLRHPRYDDRDSGMCVVPQWRHWQHVTSYLNRKSNERPSFFLCHATDLQQTFYNSSNMPGAVTKKEKKKEADAKRDAKQEQWDTQRRVNAHLRLHILCPKAYIILQGLCKWVSDKNAVRCRQETKWDTCRSSYQSIYLCIEFSSLCSL